MKPDSEEMSIDPSSEIIAPPLPEKEKEAKEVSSQGTVHGSAQPSAKYAAWFAEFEKEPTTEGKLRLGMDFMRTTLSQGETPRFKDFWECRRICLVLFKENIPAKMRTELWGEYVELSNEARRLKEILDEQAAFAIEQIELAILSIEADLEHLSTLVEHTPDIAFPEESVCIKEKQDSYNMIQKELLLLNTLAMRINGMRKEIIKTEMRIRIKNKLLERLSACGDKVFPRRKELIKNISQEFVGDIEQFVQTYFQSDEIKELPLHVLREEIKFLQLLAKILTLNTQAFSVTRQKLSECWDKIKHQEKDRKKEVHQKKQAHRQNFDLVLAQIQAFAEECRGEMTAAVCHARALEISDHMRGVELGRDEVRALKDELAKAKNLVLDREQEKEQQRALKEKEVELKKREKIQALKDELSSLIQRIHEFELDYLSSKREELTKEFDALGMNKIERQVIDRMFKQLKDAVAEKKEKAVLSLSEDDLRSLEQLKLLLKERVERRTEIKSQLEHYRKALGGSGFDFEKAMMYRELIETEKSSLEKIEAAIEELEQKIEEIEG
jgi:hypothetical protein